MLNVGFEAIPFDRVRQNSNNLVGSRYRSYEKSTTTYPMISLGDEQFFKVCSGGTPNSTISEYWNGDINWITLADLPPDDFVSEIVKTERTITESGLDNSNAKLLPVNSVVVSTRATIGRIGVTRTELATNQGFKNIIIKDTSKVLPEYLAYILTTKRDEMIQMASGATFKEISKANFCKIQIPLLPFKSQEKLVAEIDRYRHMISGAKEVIANYLPKIVCQTDIYKTIEEIAIFKPSKDEVKELQGDTVVSFVPMTDINTFNAYFAPQKNRKLAEVISGFTYFRDNDIILAKITPCFENGKAAIARNLTNGVGFGSTEYIVIRADTTLVYPEWIFYNINTQEFIDGGKAFMTGTAGQRRVDINYVKKYRIPVPPMEEQKTILDQIRHEQSLIEPSKQIIKVFTKKIELRTKEVWGE